MDRPTIAIDVYRNSDWSKGPSRLVAWIDHLEAQVPTIQVLDASARCPLCGHEGPHPHTPLEQIIYLNGMKAGRLVAANNFASAKEKQL